MIIYLTFNDQPSGVYWSQVTDVVDRFNLLPGPQVRLVALVSVRGFARTRRLIRKRQPDALVLPMAPRQRNWKWNRFWLWLVCLWLRPTGIICRGIYATALALRARDRGAVRRVCFDGRGAYAAEWEEFRVEDNDDQIRESAGLERDAVQRADFRLSVSEALVAHWRDRYGYSANAHVVIPCTLGRSIESSAMQQGVGIREELGWQPEDAVLVYSGSAVGWQAFDQAEGIISRWLQADGHRRALFLTKEHAALDRMAQAFPGRVARRWVDHAQVGAILRACDIGLLIREPLITNRVASPTKFAEYLSAGLMVAISEGVGDFSALVQRDALGQVLRPGDMLELGRTDRADAARLMDYARARFAKEHYDPEYTMLKERMGVQA